MQNPAVCRLSVVPIRAESSDKSEIVSQLLFGEIVDILEPRKDKKNWCRIKCDFDAYEGWIDPRQVVSIPSEEVPMYRQPKGFCLDIMSPLINNDHFLPVTMGASLPDFDGLNVKLADKHYTFNGQVLSSNRLPTEGVGLSEFIIKLARRYLYAPYFWGGRSPFGIDCSGFTQIVFKMSGIRLRRDASQQAEQGKTIDFLEQTQVADLAFFDNDKGNIIHVGIIMDEGFIIHASGQVRIDKLDHYGIFNEETGNYTHKLRIIKRFIPDLPKLDNSSIIEAAAQPVNDTQIHLF